MERTKGRFPAHPDLRGKVDFAGNRLALENLLGHPS
jgi:hypothetical protein